MSGELLFVEILVGALLVAVIAVLIQPLRRKFEAQAVASADQSIQRLEAEWRAQKANYEEQIAEQNRRHDAEINALRSQVEFLIRELSTARSEIEELKKKAVYLTPPVRVLLICAGDDRFCQADRQALRRANVPFERLVNASKERIRAELRRKREDGRPWRMVQVSSHANDAGIQLADNEIADPAWWNETFDGITCVVLAACQTMTVADQIAGLVRYVVAIREDIHNTDAGEFVFSFWRAVVDGLPIPDAFDKAVGETPQVAEFVAIRTA